MTTMMMMTMMKNRKRMTTTKTIMKSCYNTNTLFLYNDFPSIQYGRYKYHHTSSNSNSISNSKCYFSTQKTNIEGKNDGKEEINIYKNTVILPKTSFDQRANSHKKEPLMQKWWEEYQLYEKLQEGHMDDMIDNDNKNKNDMKRKKRFILHDGPPYANGDLHIGHALNKILKDFINRYKILQNYSVHFIPGWDCHGLPIELKVLQQLKSKERKNLTSMILREKAQLYVQKQVSKQLQAFKRYGILGSWDNPYLTLHASYEAAQIAIFGDMVKNGHVYRGRKPVHWSPSSRTALAEAELEYPKGHVSTSVYASFHVIEDETVSGKLRPYMMNNQEKTTTTTTTNNNNNKVKLIIWTTTPWTLPANLAVAVNPDVTYCMMKVKDNTGSSSSSSENDYYIIAKESIPNLLAKGIFMPLSANNQDNAADNNKKNENESENKMINSITEEDIEILTEFQGKDILGIKYIHPLYQEKVLNVIDGGSYITTDTGTGLVHTAPGHGHEDYLNGIKYGLPLLSPVDDAGRFTEEAGERFKGLSVLKEGNIEVIKALTESDSFMFQEAYEHKYPYDWRTKKPTIFRATDQWFSSVDNIREKALEAVQSVKWIPASGEKRISAMIDARSDWCISRQRTWGVPIPAFYDKDDNNKLLMDEDIIGHIVEIFREHGSDAWWTFSVEELLPDCYKHKASQYIKGKDTMDVWFDSGCSWSGVCSDRIGPGGYPADLYLEGSDQHRGWFQSSLLTSVAANGIAPYKSVLTHGFVLDEKGHKMSKSIGNTVDPHVIIEGGKNKKMQPAYGADVLRLWVSSVDYTSDVCIGDNLIKKTADSYRKLRNTARYILGNLFDFDPEQNAVQYEQLSSLDKYILGKSTETLNEVEKAFDKYQFNKASTLIYKFAVNDLSNFYLDIAKDRLYISETNNERRRSCQTVLHIILEHFVRTIAPLIPHTAEEIWHNIPYKGEKTSVFEESWCNPDIMFQPHKASFWTLLREIRSEVNKCLDKCRKQNIIGASMEANVNLYIDNSDIERKNTIMKVLNDLKGSTDLHDTVHMNTGNSNMIDDLRFLFLTSQVTIVSSMDELKGKSTFYLDESEYENGIVVGISKASGKKCTRCWYYCSTVDTVHNYPNICPRCAKAVANHSLSDALEEERIG